MFARVGTRICSAFSQTTPTHREMQSEEDHNEQDQQGPDGVNFYPDHVEYDNTEELSLDMLKDSPPGQKPLYPFSTLIRYVRLGEVLGEWVLMLTARADVRSRARLRASCCWRTFITVSR